MKSSKTSFLRLSLILLASTWAARAEIGGFKTNELPLTLKNFVATVRGYQPAQSPTPPRPGQAMAASWTVALMAEGTSPFDCPIQSVASVSVLNEALRYRGSAGVESIVAPVHYVTAQALRPTVNAQPCMPKPRPVPVEVTLTFFDPQYVPTPAPSAPGSATTAYQPKQFTQFVSVGGKYFRLNLMVNQGGAAQAMLQELPLQ